MTKPVGVLTAVVVVTATVVFETLVVIAAVGGGPKNISILYTRIINAGNEFKG